MERSYQVKQKTQHIKLIKSQKGITQRCYRRDSSAGCISMEKLRNCKN